MSDRGDFEILTTVANKIVNQVKELVTLDLRSISYKTDNDAVTNKDLALQTIIKTELAILDPSTLVVSEEDDLSKVHNTDTWVIDPLDGTSNYLQDLRYQAISIAKVQSGKVSCAIVIDLENFDVYIAIFGCGARLNGVPIVAIESRIKLVGMSTGFVRLIKNIPGMSIPDGINIRILGSQALQLCFVATGKLLANISLEAKAWDDIAGALIIRESGGSYSFHENMNENWIEMVKNRLDLKSAAFSSQASIEIKNFVEEAFNV